jgi:hypothetical protein
MQALTKCEENLIHDLGSLQQACTWIALKLEVGVNKNKMSYPKLQNVVAFNFQFNITFYNSKLKTRIMNHKLVK